MTRTTRILCAVLTGLAGGLGAQAAPAKPSAPKPAIILVHGAFADASGFSGVIRILQKDGYVVTAVQNPLSSFTDDVATTKRLIDAQTGPVVVVGHSYGGAVITTAAAGNPNVKALVYLAAFGPDSAEPVGAYLEKYPTQLGTAFRPDAAGFLYMDRGLFHSLFAADLPQIDADVAAAAQKPIHNSAFGASSPLVAWKTIPSWYVVAQDDKALSPDLERFYAKRMKATTTEIKSSHVVFISHAPEVARVIESAATGAPRP